MNAIRAIAIVVLAEMVRRKDFYVLFVITALITLLMGSVNIFNDHNVAGYLKELTLLLIWIASLVIAISAAARQLHAEKESRTIFPLLAKPVSRAQLLLGKFCGCWAACGIALLTFYVFFALVVISRDHALPVGTYLQAMVLHWGALGVVVAMALLGSMIFAAPSSTVTICFIVAVAILWLERHLNTVALNAGGLTGNALYALYFLTPRLDWAFDVRQLLIFDSPLPSLSVWTGAMVFYAGYTAVLLLGAWLLFRRRALN